MRQERTEQRMPASVEAFLLHRLRSLEGAEDGRQRAALDSELGAFYQSAGRYDAALRAFQEAGEEIGRTLGRACPEYAAALLGSAEACRGMKDAPRAAALLEEALELCRRADGRNGGLYPGVLNALSAVRREEGRLEEAAACLEESLGWLESAPEGRWREIAVTCNNLTALWHDAGDDQEALRCANRALQACGRLPTREQARCTDVLNSLAGFLYAGGDCRRALGLYRRSARRIRRFRGENEEYGVVCQNIRWVCERLGDRKGAAAALAEAERVYRRLLGPDHERTRMVAEDLARLRAPRGAALPEDGAP